MFPFRSFFFEFLHLLVDSQRQRIIEQIVKHENSSLESEQKLVEELVRLSQREDWEPIRTAVVQTCGAVPLPKIGDEVSLRFMDQDLRQPALSTSELRIQSILLDAVDLLPNICLTDYLFLFASMLCEHPVIFVSEDRKLLSCTIQFFTSILRPLSWPFPVIYSLPENCLQILNSPVPFIAGIQHSTERVLNQIVPEFAQTANPDTIYYFVDSRFVLAPKATVSKTHLPRLNKLLKELHEPIRGLFSSSQSLSISYNAKSNEFTKKTSKLPKLSEKSSAGLQLRRVDTASVSMIREYLEGMQLMMESCFSCSPGTEQEAAESAIRERLGPKDSKFLDNFFQTQTFSYFHQNHRPIVSVVASRQEVG